MVYTMSKETFGDVLERLMKDKGINQSQLSERSGITREYINMVLNKKRKGRPSMATVMALAKALEVDPTMFFETEDITVPRKPIKAIWDEVSLCKAVNLLGFPGKIKKKPLP